MRSSLKLGSKYALKLFLKKSILMDIFNRKTLSNRDENGKFVIYNPDLPKTDIKVEKSLCERLTVKSTLKYNFLMSVLF